MGDIMHITYNKHKTLQYKLALNSTALKYSKQAYAHTVQTQFKNLLAIILFL